MTSPRTVNPVGAVLVALPGVLAVDAGGRREVPVPIDGPTSLAAVLDLLASMHPSLVRRLRDETGAQRRFVNLYLDGEDVRRSNGLQTVIQAGQEVRVIQSVAGG